MIGKFVEFTQSLNISHIIYAIIFIHAHIMLWCRNMILCGNLSFVSINNNVGAVAAAVDLNFHTLFLCVQIEWFNPMLWCSFSSVFLCFLHMHTVCHEAFGNTILIRCACVRDVDLMYFDISIYFEIICFPSWYYIKYEWRSFEWARAKKATFDFSHFISTFQTLRVSWDPKFICCLLLGRFSFFSVGFCCSAANLISANFSALKVASCVR